MSEPLELRPIPQVHRFVSWPKEMPALGGGSVHFVTCHLHPTDLDQGTPIAVSRIEALVIRVRQLLDAPGLRLGELVQACRAKFAVDLDVETAFSAIQRLESLNLLGDIELHAPFDYFLSTREAASTSRAAIDALIAQRQLELLSETLLRLRTEIPFYRERLKDIALDRFDLDELRRIPMLTRGDLRRHFAELMPPQLGRVARPAWVSSSGTGSERLQVAHLGAYGLWARQDLFRQNRRARSPSCILTTPICGGAECHAEMDRPLQERLVPGLWLVLDSTPDPCNFPEAKLRAALEEIERVRPGHLLCDTAYAAPLASYVERADVARPTFDCVLASYEVPSRIHGDALRRAFGCPLFEYYTATETGPIAMECETGGSLHPSYSQLYVELVDEAGQPTRPGELGQLCITSLQKHATPLVRYLIGDVARASGPCSCCRPGQSFSKLEGRLADLITSASGALLTPRAIDRRLAPAADGVAWYSLGQRAAQDYLLTVVMAPASRQREPAHMVEALRSILGAPAEVSVRVARSLGASPSGKFRLCYAEEGASQRPRLGVAE